MLRTRHLHAQVLGFIAAILIGNCATAEAQTNKSDPPANCAAYKSVPLPAEAEKIPVPKESPGCASYRSYRGIRRPVNYSEARACAWQERLAQQGNLGQNQKEGTAWVVGGSLILADIYFNGVGVKRDIPLAIRFACEFEEASADLAFEDIAKLNGPSDPSSAHKSFEFCDYAATTFTMNFCSEYESEIDDDRRSRYYKSLQSSMNESQRAAFVKLLAAEDAYVEAHGSEVYQGGTIRAIRTIGSEGILKDLFRTELIHFEHKIWPVLSGNQIRTADALLDREYKTKLQHLQAHTEADISDGEVTAGNLSKVEETWKRYRTAWVAFAQARYPQQVEVIRAEITLDRYRLVKTI